MSYLGSQIIANKVGVDVVKETRPLSALRHRRAA